MMSLEAGGYRKRAGSSNESESDVESSPESDKGGSDQEDAFDFAIND